MTDIKLSLLDDSEAVRQRAEDYLFRIAYGTDYIRRLGITPTVLMSVDVIEDIYRTHEEVVVNIRISPKERKLTVLGYDVKTVHGNNVLVVGMDMMEGAHNVKD